ncbi:cell cycle control protein, G10 family protein (macronuclear) [Tetrahymena thermophila SB210]|uniref:Cell cycle control protein, G10 family protein n=1 Tax=Tetrahymena thermophila (strain SB210) TaxID=312017 RepID=A4VEH3_TETTS|nr:cell cycle control protein, G10 family protein [Tetrahymena thermophila SB210]EDK31927.1 cell cycle control protein, G10 family protein [Tetrahymena thermophila SB210]|eukprot:XP_001471201.1 cell cycle control protein, G10 family protein [Tetrahymena thermophila SB210]
MPRIQNNKTKKTPPGWDRIEQKLLELTNKMRDVENEPHEGKRKVEALWPIYQIHHERSRYVYEMFYKAKPEDKISRELYEYCLREKWADADLIAKWKKKGYEKLCCLQCIQPKDHNYGGTCICRVPKGSLEEGKVVQCQACGCRGCASCD